MTFNNNKPFNSSIYTKKPRIKNELLTYLNNSEDTIVIFNEQGHLYFINNKAEQLLSISNHYIDTQLIGQQPVFNSWTRKKLLVIARQYFQTVKAGIPQLFERVEWKKNKPTLAINILISQGVIDKTLVYFATIKNILPCKLAELDQHICQKELQFLTRIPDQDPNAVIWIHPDGSLIFANEQGKKIYKNWQRQYSGLPPEIISHISQAQSSDKLIRDEIQIGQLTYLIALSWVADLNQINIYGTDISQLKTAEDNILNLAHYDALTQVANRQYFEKQLSTVITSHKVEQEKFALLLIDIDNFKKINDNFGHLIGDRLLKVAAKRMQRCLRTLDFIARPGGDEFTIILANSDEDAAVTVAKKINQKMSLSFQFGDYRLDVTCSIGVSMFPDSASTASQLLNQADIAMYHSKKCGKNKYTLFLNHTHDVDHKRKTFLKNELVKATAKNQLFIDYQPFVNLDNGGVSGYESYMRWQHPVKGLILPSEFIPMAEQTGSINAIGQWGIEQALLDYTSIISTLPAGIKLDLNISVMQINDARFIDTLLDSLQKYHMTPSQIILDISEHILTTKVHDLYKKLNSIHKQGIKLSLDNFGSPRMSLIKLSKLPIQYLKLDQKLLCDIENDEKSQLLLSGIIELAKKLRIIVIQKGVETTQQNEILKSLGCPFAQGNFYCPPVKLEELKQFITKDKKKR